MQKKNSNECIHSSGCSTGKNRFPYIYSRLKIKELPYDTYYQFAYNWILYVIYLNTSQLIRGTPEKSFFIV